MSITAPQCLCTCCDYDVSWSDKLIRVSLKGWLRSEPVSRYIYLYMQVCTVVAHLVNVSCVVEHLVIVLNYLIANSLLTSIKFRKIY